MLTTIYHGSLTTTTLFDASNTCTVGCVYFGAILTAVCCLEVVAPPISSGMLKPTRCISLATWVISVREGVIKPDRPT